MQSEHKAMVINNIIYGVIAITLILGLYALGAGGWCAFGGIPFLGMTYLKRVKDAG